MRAVRKVIVTKFMGLVEVVQGHGDAGKDTSGGWQTPHFYSVSLGWQVEHLSSAAGLILGRRTYDILARYWPSAPAVERDLAEMLNVLPKYVISRTLVEPLSWNNARLVGGPLLAFAASTDWA
jgi:dihydrofolate reductase